MLGGEAVLECRIAANLVEVDGHVNVAQPILQPVEGLLLGGRDGGQIEPFKGLHYNMMGNMRVIARKNKADS
jgi:hypothetical protein